MIRNTPERKNVFPGCSAELVFGLRINSKRADTWNSRLGFRALESASVKVNNQPKDEIERKSSAVQIKDVGRYVKQRKTCAVKCKDRLFHTKTYLVVWCRLTHVKAKLLPVRTGFKFLTLDIFWYWWTSYRRAIVHMIINPPAQEHAAKMKCFRWDEAKMYKQMGENSRTY